MGGVWSSLVVCPSLSLVLASGSVAPADASFQIRVHAADSALALRRAALDAQRRLRDPRCAALFSEFKDAGGRTLQQNLDAMGLSAADYLSFVIFMDVRDLKPSPSRRCEKPGTLAMTQPGGRIVGVCSEKLVRAVAEGSVDITVIHETLHTLGLGENPPTSAEIDQAVVRRCGR